MNEFRRKSGRLDFTGVDCELGEIENISAGGLVVKGRPTKEGRGEIRIGDDDDAVTLQVEQLWAQRVGFRKFMVGYKFIDPPPDLMQQIRKVKLPETRSRVI